MDHKYSYKVSVHSCLIQSNEPSTLDKRMTEARQTGRW